MKITTFLIATVFAIVNGSCTRQSSEKNGAGFAVEWELLSNPHEGQDYAEAQFTLHFAGKTKNEITSWALYFNMAPQVLLPASDTAAGKVVHLNGDLYKLIPGSGFAPVAGEVFRIKYRFAGCNSKETDAPCGLYFVANEGQEGKEKISIIDNYTILPFISAAQVRCHGNDSGPLPGPANRYADYAELLSYEEGIPPEFIPSPVKCNKKPGQVVVGEEWTILSGEGLENEAGFLKQKLEDIAGVSIAVSVEKKGSSSYIALIRDEETGLGPEGYSMVITSDSVIIRGGPAGIFYGIQSLISLLPFDTYRTKPGTALLPVVYIEDHPRFGYRGLHVDVCRNFQTKGQLLKVIDLMARYKLNRLHLLLSEDEAWRLEIKSLPELTAIASRRGHTRDELTCLPPAYGSGPFADAPGNRGTGYYTQEDYKEILLYAAERHIQVIPCMNLPGHARAAIKAMEARYHALMKEGKTEEASEYRLTDPQDRSVYRSAQFYNDNVVCVANESVYHFIETVVDEIISLYQQAGVPLKVFHTGGDEVPGGAWTASPACERLLENHPELGHASGLQTYFFGRFMDILDERGLLAAGWEEIAMETGREGGTEVNKAFAGRNCIPYIWNNLQGAHDRGYRIAAAGYRVVLCPVTNLYFDLAYNADPEEPGLYWGGYNSERDAWEFDPGTMFPPGNDGRSEEVRKNAMTNILGLQAQLWHETIKDEYRMEYYLLPKLAAFAERCWSPAPVWENLYGSPEKQDLLNKNWKAFSGFLYAEELPRLRYLNGGYAYRIPAAGAIVDHGVLRANAAYSGHIIRYTADGSEPGEKSKVYSAPLPLNGDIRLKVFDRSGYSGRTVSIR